MLMGVHAAALLLLVRPCGTPVPMQEAASLNVEMADMAEVRAEMLREVTTALVVRHATTTSRLKFDDDDDDDDDEQHHSREPEEAVKLAWHVDPPTVNIQLGQEEPFPSSSQSIDIKTQRGECEGVQVWLPAIAEGNASVYDGELQNVSVSVGDLRADSAAMDEAGLARGLWQFYQQGYVNASATHAYMCMSGPNCSTPGYCGCGHQCDPYPRSARSAPAFLNGAYESQSLASDGWMPSFDWYADPLLPLRDGEAVPRVQVQDLSCFVDNSTASGCDRTCWRGRTAVAILAEICVPRSAQPGNYSGSATLSFETRVSPGDFQCNPNSTATQCNVCAACCHDYILGDGCAMCVAEQCPPPPPPHSSTVEILVTVEVWPLTLPETNASDAFSTAFNWGPTQPRYVGTPNGPGSNPRYNIYGFHCGVQTTAVRGKGGYYPNLTYAQGMAQWLPFLTEQRLPAFNLYGGWDGTLLNTTTNAIEQNPVPCHGLDWYQLLADYGAKDLNLMLVPQCVGCNESALNATVNNTLRKLEPAVAALTKAGLIDKAVVYGFDEMSSKYNASLRRIYGAVKERFPMLRTMATLDGNRGWTDMDTSLPVDIWVETYNAYWNVVGPHARGRQVAKWRAAGKEYWWYWCLGPRQPNMLNTFVERPAIDGRMLFWLAALYKVPGMLYYSTDDWSGLCNFRHGCEHASRINSSSLVSMSPMSVQNHPFNTGTTLYSGDANGDGFLMYPGPDGPVASIRLKSIRDGIEDWQLFQELRRHVPDSKVDALLRTVVDTNASKPQEVVFVRDPIALERARHTAGEWLKLYI